MNPLAPDLAPDLARIAAIGILATVAMDLWLLLLARMGVRTLDFALVGRWLGHLQRGRWRHAGIAQAAPVPLERVLGWTFHYAVGVAFAAVLVGLQGTGWTREPTLLPALAFGLATVAAPLFVLQPAMGAGIASSRTAAPLKNALRSVANHAVFGVGLYLAATLVARVAP